MVDEKARLIFYAFNLQNEEERHELRFRRTKETVRAILDNPPKRILDHEKSMENMVERKMTVGKLRSLKKKDWKPERKSVNLNLL